ncbi:MAG: methylenetetrahydrofolate reductase [Acidimicrobiales bacterium]
MSVVLDALDRGRSLSFEFYPPKTPAGEQRLSRTIDELESIGPDFVSVPYGAGGTTRARTRDTVIEICAERRFPAMPHLTCVGQTRAELEQLVDDYATHGVDHLLALAGDPPPDDRDGGDPGELHHARELVQLVKERTDMTVAVAVHPEIHPRSTSRAMDRRHLADKLAVADFAITQFFFDSTDYARLVGEVAAFGAVTPVIPGIMPVINPASVKRFADLNGTRTPPELWARVEQAADAAERLEVAVDAACELIEAVLAIGAPGVHLYTLNDPAATRLICERAGLGQAG